MEEEDPIERVRKYLHSKVALERRSWRTDDGRSSRRQIDAAVEKAEEFKPDPKTMFEQRLQLHA